MRLTAANLVRAISALPRDVHFQYINPSNAGRIAIHRIQEPEGPIEFKRYNPKKKGKTLAAAKVETISSTMLWRMANAILPGRPINVDRIFGGSYNMRSVMEALLAHTPEFYWCKPGRIEDINGKSRIKAGHKHLLYKPDEPHENGVTVSMKVDFVVSELATADAVYSGMELATAQPNTSMTPAEQRRHAQMQIALIVIGKHLGFRTWVAANDHSIKYGGQRLADMEGVIKSLANEVVLTAYADAQRAAHLIDCIWFRNGRLMPAVIEIEHSTGVRSGLDRMLRFAHHGPALRDIRWTIVAPDEDRSKVIEICNEPNYRDMRAKFFPYSGVEELYSICERRKPKGITDQFLDCFMEDCVTS